uniref:Zinc finger protein 665-like n=1 Tax=Salmo trutta TaxID=8032 RepID=A0A673W0S0_SALTR
MTHPGEKQPDAAKKHPCSDCGKECFSAYELKMHMRRHTGERPHQCSYCEMSFGCKGTLSRHVRRHTGAPTPKPYQCSQCGKRYESPSRLRQHQTMHTGEKPYECSDCGRGFASTEGLRKHQCSHASNHSQCTLGIPDTASSGSQTMNIKIKDEEQELAINVKEEEEEIGVFVNTDREKPYQCTTCKNAFVHPSSLVRHKQSHTSVAQYSCSECGKEFSQSWTFKIHMQQHTGEKLHHCCQCDKSFSALSLLRRHQLVHTRVKPYPCSLCRNRFSSSANRSSQRHHVHAKNVAASYLNQSRGQGSQQQVSILVLDVKEKEEDPAFAERPDHCSESEGSPSTSGLPEQHQGNHTAKKIHFCSVCGKNCHKLSKLQIHMRTHTGEKPYSCSVCGKQFSEKGNLKKHQTLHTGEKLFSCSVCGESFSSSSNLTKHQRTHTGESQVSVAVEVCGLSPALVIKVKEEEEDPAFAERHDHCSDSEGSPSTSGLPEQNQGNHTAKKIHFCSVCGKNCQKLSKLQIHMRTHTGEKPYSCSVCGKQFSDKGNLKKHQTVHTGEKLYSCSVCGESFSSSSNLTKHQRTHTGESQVSVAVEVCGLSPALVIKVKEEEEDPAFGKLKGLNCKNVFLIIFYITLLFKGKEYIVTVPHFRIVYPCHLIPQQRDMTIALTVK